MKGIILLNFNENTKKVEEEEKLKFLFCTLEQMGVPMDEFLECAEFLVEHKIKLKNILTNFGIQVIDNMEEMKIYVDQDLIACWSRPTYVLKRDLSQLDKKKQLYLEMHIDYFSVFEEDVQENAC